MACALVVWHAFLAFVAMSMLLAALHTNELHTVLRAAVEYASRRRSAHHHASEAALSMSAKGDEAFAVHKLEAAFAAEGGNWVRMFGEGEASDDAFDEDAVRLLLTEADTLDEQWRFQAAEVKLRDALRRVSDWLADLREDNKPGTQRDRATRQAIEVQLRLGRFLEERGRAADAVPSLRLATELASTLSAVPLGRNRPTLPAVPSGKSSYVASLDAEHSDEARIAQVRSEAGLARTLCQAGGRQGAAVHEARMLFTRALARRQGLPQLLEAQVHADFAECLHREGALADARAGLAASRRLLDTVKSGSAVKLVEQAMLERRLARLQGGVAHDDGAFADAIDLYGEYLRTAPEPQDQLPPLVSVLQRFEVLQDMSLALASLGKLQEAYANMDDVERLQKSTGEEVSLKAHGDEGGSRKFLAPIAVDRRLQASVARTLVVRAELELEQSRIQSHRPTLDAEHLSQEAVAILREAAASASDLENALNTLGNVHMSLGETSKAEDAYREAVSLAVEDHGKRSPLVAALYHNLASALEGMGKLTEAVKLYTRALDIQLVTLGEANPDTAGSLDSLARCLSKRGLPTEALEAAQRAAKAARAAYPEGHWLRSEAEERLKKLKPPISLTSSKEFLVSAREVHRVADA